MGRSLRGRGKSVRTCHKAPQESTSRIQRSVSSAEIWQQSRSLLLPPGTSHGIRSRSGLGRAWEEVLNTSLAQPPTVACFLWQDRICYVAKRTYSLSGLRPIGTGSLKASGDWDPMRKMTGSKQSKVLTTIPGYIYIYIDHRSTKQPY